VKGRAPRASGKPLKASPTAAAAPTAAVASEEEEEDRAGIPPASEEEEIPGSPLPTGDPAPRRVHGSPLLELANAAAAAAAAQPSSEVYQMDEDRQPAANAEVAGFQAFEEAEAAARKRADAGKPSDEDKLALLSSFFPSGSGSGARGARSTLPPTGSVTLPPVWSVAAAKRKKVEDYSQEDMKVCEQGFCLIPLYRCDLYTII
jgi:hypothetical protein